MYRFTKNFDLIITIFYKTSCQCFVKFHLAKLVSLVFLFLFHSGVLGLFIYLLTYSDLKNLAYTQNIT